MLSEETIQQMMGRKQVSYAGCFGKDIKVRPQKFIDFSQVKLPKRKAKAVRDLDISYKASNIQVAAPGELSFSDCLTSKD